MDIFTDDALRVLMSLAARALARVPVSESVRTVGLPLGVRRIGFRLLRSFRAMMRIEAMAECWGAEKHRPI